MKLLLIVLLVTFSFSIFAQQSVQKANSRLNVTALPKYDAITGKKLSTEEFVEMARKYPGIVPRQEINKYGEVAALHFDPRKSGRVSYRDTSLRVKSGEDFLPFEMRTIDGLKMSSKKLMGKKVVLHWQLFLQTPGFIETALIEISSWVRNNQNNEEIVFIVLTESSKNEIDASILEMYKDEIIVPNARNFAERYCVTSYPSNILIDEEGKLVGYYDNLEFDKLKADW